MVWNELHSLILENNNMEIKDSVLSRGTVVRERAELSGMTPILKACMYGRRAAFDELIELGNHATGLSKFNYHKGDNMLTGSSKMEGKYNPEDYLSIARYLLKEGSSLLTKKNRAGMDPLELAKQLASGNKCPMVEMLEKKKREIELQNIDKAVLEQKKRPKVRRL